MPAEEGNVPREIAGLHEFDYPGWIGQEVRALRQEFPEWDIWFVAAYLSPGTWCARPKGAEVATVNRIDPADFRAALRAAEDPEAAEAAEESRRVVLISLEIEKRSRKAQS